MCSLNHCSYRCTAFRQLIFNSRQSCIFHECYHSGSSKNTLCQRNGVAVIPWSPLARGRLTRPWGETTARLVSDEFGKSLYSTSEENDAQIAGNLADVAEELDASRAQVALAWLLSKPGVAAPIIGPSRQEQLDDLLQAVDLTLSPEQIDKLEAPYQPHPVVGFK